jgi:hypothetical protein
MALMPDGEADREPVLHEVWTDRCSPEVAPFRRVSLMLHRVGPRRSAGVPGPRPVLVPRMVRTTNGTCCVKWGQRLQVVGLAQNGSYDLPVTQTELADALGLTTVHVNRTLQQLRHDGLITVRGGTVTLSDPEGLKQAGEFDPGYLHVGRMNGIDGPPSRHMQRQEPHALHVER